MAFAINHNLMAANTARNLNTHYGNLATSTQRLSSGLRINGAADDAAGLAIRELMRADIAAYNQGIRNANDAISMIQVVDGALGVIDEKLIRMKELAEQSATGTYDSTQRLMIDSEFQAMASEVQRIATATDFNGIKLIDTVGIHSDFQNVILDNIVTLDVDRQEVDIKYTMSAPSSPPSLERGVRKDVYTRIYKGTQSIEYYKEDNKIFKKTCNDIMITTKWTASICNLWHRKSDISDQLKTEIQNDPHFNTQWDILHEHGYEILEEALNRDSMEDILSTPSSVNYHNWLPNGDLIHVYSFNYDINNDGVNDIRARVSTSYFHEIEYIKDNIRLLELELDPGIFVHPDNIEVDQSVKLEEVRLLPADTSVKIHFGPMNDSGEDYYDIEKRDCTLKGLGLEDVRIETQDNAQKALVTINNAIVKKDQARAYYGAMQNRLENTVSNLTIQAENLQASESRISDVDVATEMTNFVRNQILTQSAVAMLSQANSMPQMAMQLIGG